ncbi:MAG: cytochrome c oxidase accessory protein CcoG [Bdellovibrionota bacterium]
MYSFAGPAEVSGKYQKIRNFIQPALIIIFLVLPWLKMNEQPVLLLDFFNRHFVFFGRSFFSHDAPLLFFLVILLVLSIFTLTAIFGRLWCGWSCPQTVFLHALYNKVEKFIMGTYAKRKVFYKEEVNLLKTFKIILLYTVFFSISWVLAHSFVAYFLGAETVTKYIFEGPTDHLKPFAVLMIMTAVLFLNFTYMREKFCYLICPYGRFQNALIDRNTLIVLYDKLRGEPRGKTSIQNIDKGDCVDCSRCVTVCPVNIDIRNGFQQECIACGKCIDACNAVMKKLNNQPYLIRFETGDQKKITLKRFRLVLYAGLILIFSSALVWTIVNRGNIDLTITRASGAPFSARLNEGHKIFQNQFLIHMKNQTAKSIDVNIELSEQNIKDGYVLLSAINKMQLNPEQDLKTPVFIEIEKSKFSSSQHTLEIILQSSESIVQRKIDFIGLE